jgi:DDE superfamily endonuclease/Helicase HerA, central domain
MSANLKLAPGLAIPAARVGTQTFRILAKRGAGKSNAAAVMAEEMFADGVPFVVVDPVGSWWGLRSSADGKHEGLPIPILGGHHGDVPLARGRAELVADLIVDENLSCVLDVSSLEFHYTPKHGSWLNMAEIEISVLGRQCLNRRIDHIDLLRTTVQVWEAKRNDHGVQIQWRFTVSDARTTMHRVYAS